MPSGAGLQYLCHQPTNYRQIFITSKMKQSLIYYSVYKTWVILIKNETTQSTYYLKDQKILKGNDTKSYLLATTSKVYFTDYLANGSLLINRSDDFCHFHISARMLGWNHFLPPPFYYPSLSYFLLILYSFLLPLLSLFLSPCSYLPSCIVIYIDLTEKLVHQDYMGKYDQSTKAVVH